MSCSNGQIVGDPGLVAISIPSPVQSGNYLFKANAVQHSLTLNVFVINDDPPTQAFDWASTLPMDAIIIQSSTLFAQVYVFDPPGEITAGTDNRAAAHSFILDLTFCYDKDDPIGPAGVDQDKDGCMDELELLGAEEAASGGGRDPLYFWDFADQWIGQDKDRSVVVGDIGAVVARFGSVRGSTPTEPESLAEALTPPPAMIGYHASADRGTGLTGPNVWNVKPPDGSIVISDIGAVVSQFGHSCA